MKSVSIGGWVFGMLAAGCAADAADRASGESAQALVGTTAVAPYLVPLRSNVSFEALLSVGDAATDSGYRMVGIPDGLGAWKEGGELHLAMNHEVDPLSATPGVVRAHGAPGGFISHWTIDRHTHEVEDGADLIQGVALWNLAAGRHDAPAYGVTLARFCSGDLPDRSAFFDRATRRGYRDRLYMAGEEADEDGRAFAHDVATGISYELPRMGRMGFENLVARAHTGVRTVVVGTDDGAPAGEVVVYVGSKQATGTPPARAGLTNGRLYGIRVPGYPRETLVAVPPAAAVQLAPPAPGTPVELVDFGDVTGLSEAALQALETASGVTVFDRPEDAHWNPADGNQILFTTTAAFTRSTRLWRITFANGANPAAGGTIECLIDGNTWSLGGVTPRMFDNMTVTDDGRWVYLQEDPGNQAHLAKIWRFDLRNRELQLLAQHDPARFTVGLPGFLTQDEESSGIIDVSRILGPGKLVLDVQVHRAESDPELIQGGQLLIMSVDDGDGDDGATCDAAVDAHDD